MKLIAWLKQYHRWVLAVLICLFLSVFGWELLSDSSAPTKHPTNVHSATSPAPKAIITKQLPVDDNHTFAIAAGSSLTTLSDSQLTTRLDGIKASGATWIRFDFDWSQIQPNSAQSYDWTAYDRLVQYATARNLHVLGIIDYTPAWARPTNCSDSNKCAPANPAQYAKFAATLADRYSPKGVHAWEVWNEPNNPNFWQPTVSPSDYTAMLKLAYVALHQADSLAYVLTGGLSPQATDGSAYAPYDFLNGIYKSGGQGYFDAVADHPYTFPLTPAANADDAWTQMAASSHSLRSLMVADGDGTKKIWITEFGSPTGGPGPLATLANPNLSAKPYVVDDALQAKILADSITLYNTYPWAGPFFYYSYQDAGTDPSTNENFFGLINAAGTPKPAYAVFQQAVTSPATPR